MALRPAARPNMTPAPVRSHITDDAAFGRAVVADAGRGAARDVAARARHRGASWRAYGAVITVADWTGR